MDDLTLLDVDRPYVGRGLGGGSQEPRLPSVTIGSGPLPSSEAANAPLFDLTRYGTPAPDAIAQATADVSAPIVLDKHPGMRDGRPQLIHTINATARWMNAAPRGQQGGCGQSDTDEGWTGLRKGG